MPHVRRIDSAGGTIAYVITGAESPSETTFVTSPDANLQVGYIVKSAGEDIARHDHKKVERNIAGTAEVLVVRDGSCEIEFYDEGRSYIESTKVSAGDVVVMLSGGHGFKILEDTVFLEVKQGPYPGLEEKDQF